MINHRPYDLSRVTEGGHLILPLSMSKLHGAQSPQKIYEFLEWFGPNKAPHRGSLDCIFLYTSGLYFNSENVALDLRKQLSNQMTRHADELKKMIVTRKEFNPKAFQILPWDYIVLNSLKYTPFLSKLSKKYSGDEVFQRLVARDLAERQRTEANIQFVLEELVVTHLIQRQFVDLPFHLSGEHAWRLICYPGAPLLSYVYMSQQSLLPDNKNVLIKNKYCESYYNFKDRELFNFEHCDLELKNSNRPIENLKFSQAQ